jgi:hypothetical protein
MPSAYWQPLLFNRIVIGANGRTVPRTLNDAVPELQPLVSDLLAKMQAVPPSGDPWTDDRAPVEWITDRMIVEFAAKGGRFEEEPLPTAP